MAFDTSFIDGATKTVPDTLKQSIGKLIVVNAGEADPARKIHYASALITHIRAALFYIANTTDQKEFSDILHGLMYNILRSEYDVSKIQWAFNRIDALFVDKPRTRYDLMLVNDIALIQQCRNNWKTANSRYFNSPDAWETSNDILADVQDVLVEVATRWNLVIIPRDMPFNISQIPNLTFAPSENTGTTPLDE
jgi:hypothetical protein